MLKFLLKYQPLAPVYSCVIFKSARCKNTFHLPDFLTYVVFARISSIFYLDHSTMAKSQIFQYLDLLYDSLNQLNYEDMQEAYDFLHKHQLASHIVFSQIRLLP